MENVDKISKAFREMLKNEIKYRLLQKHIKINI